MGQHLECGILEERLCAVLHRPIVIKCFGNQFSVRINQRGTDTIQFRLRLLQRRCTIKPPECQCGGGSSTLSHCGVKHIPIVASLPL